MHKVISFAFLMITLALAASAEVIPFVDDRPLTLRPDPISNGISGQNNPLPTLDYWLNVCINSDNSGQVQNEQQVVVNPLNPNNVVAVWRDFRLGYRRVGGGYSFDGGHTWVDELFFEPTYPWQSDPGMTWHTSGALYSVVLSFDPSGEDGLFVSKTTNGGLTWGPWIPAVNAVANSFEDKELMACDRSGSQYDGNLYIAWARFTNNQTVSRITMVRSTNGGVSWGTATSVSDLTSVQWPVPAVGPNGEVYVAWVKYGNPSKIQMDVSTNGGVTWGTDRLVQNTSFASAYINPMLTIFSFPAMDVDITNGPNRGTIYVVYTNDVYGDADLFFTKSTNSGTTWSAPTRVNDDATANGCDQFHPWLVCDEAGILHLIFYDRRNDPVQNLFMDLYYTKSSDAGAHWSPNERITTVSSNPANDSLDSGLIGEYNGLAVRNGVVHPVWTDTRDLNQDTYTAVLGAPPVLKHPQAGSQIGGGLVDASPSPFNERLNVTLHLPQSGGVDLAVYDVTGSRVATLAQGEFEMGTRQWSWQPEVSSGVYWVVARTAAGVDYQKVLYLK